MSLFLSNKKNVPVRKEATPFFALQNGINGIFDDFWKGWGDFGLAPSSFFEKDLSFSPSMDISETDGEYKVSLELPGMEEKDIDLSIDDNSLTIKGEKKEEKEEKKKNYHVKEMSYGSFFRSIPLPKNIKTDEIKANFNKGILDVTLPKTEEAKKSAKKIEIKS